MLNVPLNLELGLALFLVKLFKRSANSMLRAKSSQRFSNRRKSSRNPGSLCSAALRAQSSACCKALADSLAQIVQHNTTSAFTRLLQAVTQTFCRCGDFGKQNRHCDATRAVESGEHLLVGGWPVAGSDFARSAGKSRGTNTWFHHWPLEGHHKSVARHA